MSSAQNRFKAQLREIKFVLFEHLKFQDILGTAPFAAWGQDEVDMVLTETERFAKEVTGPINASADREGAQLVDGKVKTPTGFKEAWAKLFEAGWYTLSGPEAYGGQGSPYTLHAVVEEFIAGSNVSFGMYPGLAYGAAEVIHAFATPAQKERYLRPMFGGTWGGTMCLTEPHAGSDVGSARTTAKKLPDGTYAIRGTKMFITAGDSDLVDNVIHLVLARVEGAVPGTKGLSLFIVPKLKIDGAGKVGGANDVAVASIEHKMGLNGSATCALSFGEGDACVGELVGTEEHVGMSQMFKLMNGARIAVGLQGLGVASSAYLNALEYARDRKQGAHITKWKDASAPRVPIIEHPDVRRMLLDMKAKVEGLRALIYKLSLHLDRANAAKGKDDAQVAYHTSQIDLLTPLVKSYGADQAFRICETAIQTFGGAGYTRDYPVEQYCRDSKVFSIYEGTTHIQAMDLIGRKLAQNGGNNFRTFLGEIQAFVGKHGAHATVGADVQGLGKAAEALGASAMLLLMWFQSGKMALVPLHSVAFLEMMSETTVAWLLLEQAVIADEAGAKLGVDHPDRAFYAGKVQAARYYARNVLPSVQTRAGILKSEDATALDIADESFGPTA